MYCNTTSEKLVNWVGNIIIDMSVHNIFCCQCIDPYEAYVSILYWIFTKLRIDFVVFIIIEKNNTDLSFCSNHNCIKLRNVMDVTDPLTTYCYFLRLDIELWQSRPQFSFLVCPFWIILDTTNQCRASEEFDVKLGVKFFAILPYSFLVMLHRGRIDVVAVNVWKLLLYFCEFVFEIIVLILMK